MNRKLEKLLKLLEELDLDFLVLTQTPNLEYVLEIELEVPTLYIVLYRDKTYRIYVSKLDYWRIIDAARIEPENVIPFSRPGIGEALPREIQVDKVVEHLVREKVRKIGTDSVTSRLIAKLKEKFNVEVIDVQDRISQLRSIKDDIEIDLISKAVRISEKCLEETLHKIEPGIREIDIEAWLAECIIEHEASLAFKPIVASGPNSAYPHHTSTPRKIERGDVVVVDLGARYRCYCSDITRTIVVGSPTEEKREIIEKVAVAQEEAIKRARPGIEAERVDEAARSALGEYARFFIHNTGHGLGVEFHERPSIAQGEKEKLVQGNVITIEPGVYIRGKFGVRIEDDVLVTESGPKMLTAFPRLLL